MGLFSLSDKAAVMQELLMRLVLRVRGRQLAQPASHPPTQRLPLRAMYETAGAASGTATGLRDGLRGAMRHTGRRASARQ